MSQYCKACFLLALTLLVSVCSVDVGCRAEEQSAKSVGVEFQLITPAVASRLIVEKEDLIIVDVRTPAERELAAIENSVLIPVTQMLKGDFSLSKKQPLLIYCAVGGRSYYAAKYLKFRGYHEIYDLQGGIEAWKRAGLPVITGEK